MRGLDACVLLPCLFLALLAGPPGVAGAAAPPAGVAPAWWDEVRQSIATSEYRISEQAQAATQGGTNTPQSTVLQAPNRAHGFRTWFAPDGVRLEPRDGSGTYAWSVALAAIGRAGDVRPVAGAQLAVDGNRVDYRRGAVTEWYVNDTRGLELGVTLSARPTDNAASSGPLVLEFASRGTVAVRPVPDGRALDLVGPNASRVLRCASLRVVDASGRDVPAHFAATPAGFAIEIDDGTAAYPLVVDPLITGPAWTAESDQVLANFGWSVASAGDVNGDGYGDVVVGAPRFDAGQIDEGKVFVYYGTPSGLPAAPSWTAEGDQPVAWFGSAVSMAGDVDADGFFDLVIGARLYDHAGVTDAGAAFLFRGSATGLDLSAARPIGTPAAADWSAYGSEPGSGFGTTVATAGDVNGDGDHDVLVGAPGFDGTLVDQGAVSLFLGSPAGLTAASSWTATGGQVAANFGVALATAGDVNADGYADIIVGADGFSNADIAEGQAFVYYGSPAGPAATPNWTARGAQAVSGFGSSVFTAGDVNGDGYADVIVGAHAYDDGEIDEGAAFVFHGSATGLDAGGTRPVGLPSNADWRVESDQPSADLGSAVSTAGDMNGDGYADVIVGAKAYDDGEPDEGAVFVYYGSATGLGRAGTRTVGRPSNADWSAEGQQPSAEFGAAVAYAGDVNGDGFSDVIVGAPKFDAMETDEGRAFVYLGGSGGIGMTPAWESYGTSDSYTGFSVAGAGDVNGDGYADVIVGAPYYDEGYYDRGRAQVFLGSSTGLSTTPAWTILGSQYSELFGYSVAGAGDVNGDGYADVIVGSPNYHNTQGYEGRAQVFLGSSGGLSSDAAWQFASGESSLQLGIAVASAGDVDGDGYADVIAGGSGNGGKALVFRGSGGGPWLTPSWTLVSTQGGAEFGAAVACAGDVNGDGFSDVIVGSPSYHTDNSNQGRADVFLGGPSGLTTTPVWSTYGVTYAEYLGRSVAGAGDVNGDGYSDVIIGSPNFSNYAPDPGGRAQVFLGSPTGPSTTPSWRIAGTPAGAQTGYSVAGAGDVNGDGYADVLVSSRFLNAGNGKVDAYFGSPTGLSSTPQWTVQGSGSYFYFGSSVAGAGDVNGDGYADVIIGVPSMWSSYGRAVLYYGNGGQGRDLSFAQRRADDSGRIMPLGWSDARSAFRVTLANFNPFGSTRTKLQWEAKPTPTAFDGSGTGQSASWSPAVPQPGPFNELVDRLTDGAGYHWRVRLLYDRGESPFLLHGRWMSMPWKGAAERDLGLPVTNALALSITDDPDPYVLDFHTSGITYTLTVANNGTEGSNVSVDDRLPDGIALISATPSQGYCRQSGTRVVCSLGALAAGAHATIAIVVMPSTPGTYTNTAVLRTASVNVNPANDTATQSTSVWHARVGDRVWADLNGNGLQDDNEPGIVSALVYLFDGATGSFLDVTFTDTHGNYAFHNVRGGPTYKLRFVPPTGYTIAPRDRGTDDLLDSDADPATGDTAVFSIGGAADAYRWDAGMVPPVTCEPPDERLYVYGVTLTADGNAFPVLNFMDPNQPTQATGYDVYRSSNPALPHAQWPLVASDVVDMDQATPNKQWIDISGDVSPTGIWYYHVVAYNHRCPAEGPW